MSSDKPRVSSNYDKDAWNGLPKRLQKEIQRLKRNKQPDGISINVNPNNLRHFFIKIETAKESLYAGQIFEIEMFITNKYPMKPPKARFLTKIYHPNVDKIGRICLDVLKDKWTPALTVSRLCLSIQCLMQVK